MTPEEQGAVKLDLNNPVFQKHLFALSKEEQVTVLRTLRKLSQMTWNQIYQDRGFKWELVYSRTGQAERVFIALDLERDFEG